MTDLNKYYQLSELIAAYLADEKKHMPAELVAWLEESFENKAIFENIVKEEQLKVSIKKYNSIDVNDAWNRVSSKLFTQNAVIRKRFWPRIAAAAAILLVVGAGIFFYTNRSVTEKVQTPAYANDIAPGKNTATITLTDGSTIVLSDAKTGVVVGAESLRYNDGSAVRTGDARHLDDRRTDQRELNETDKNNINSELNLLNSTDKRSLPYGRDDVRGVDGRGSRNNARGGLLTASTPRGGTYQVTLPDGTKVWLNAASSIKFPASFAALKERRVFLNGEAYFEVSKDKAHPFIVKSASQEVEVLGTHFNVNAYAGEPNTKTTLLEGAVKVAGNDGQSQTIKPDQQAVLSADGIKVFPVVAETYIDWTEGSINVRKEDLRSIMRKVSRWYNVEVEYQGVENDGQTFTAYVSRRQNLSLVLDALAKVTNLKFKITGNKIIVSK
jgi:ferric-dicitrate binding protein FerR (iron transport regulator)